MGSRVSRNSLNLTVGKNNFGISKRRTIMGCTSQELVDQIMNV